MAYRDRDVWEGAHRHIACFCLISFRISLGKGREQIGYMPKSTIHRRELETSCSDLRVTQIFMPALELADIKLRELCLYLQNGAQIIPQKYCINYRIGVEYVG